MPLPNRPGQAQPRTLSEAKALLSDARWYASRLESTARAQNTEERSLLRELDRLRAGLSDVQRDLATAREDHTRTEERLRTTECERLRSRSELGQLRDDLTEQISKLTTQAETLRQQAEQAEEEQAQADEAAATDPTQPQEDEKQAGPALSMVQLLQRRLQEEQTRRIAAEERIAQLLSESESGNRHRQLHTPPPPLASAPGQYQRHAAAVGYDITRDPLLALMRDEVIVSDRCADWQARHCLRRTARRRDPTQTLDEQAYAAAIAARWRLVDHPHVRLSERPTWRLLGCLLDERSEAYLLTLTQERIDEMRGWLSGAG